jgi:hypothetical protein
MLEQLRKQSRSAIIYLLFGLIIFVFVFSFGAGSRGFREGGCGRTDVAALVNGEKISNTVFQFYYNLSLDAYSRRKNPGGGGLREEEKSFLRRNILDTLVNRSLLMQAARRAGLWVTDQERNDSIKKSPQFLDEDKKFNLKLYRNMVQIHYRTSPAIFEEIWRNDMLSSRMAGIIMDTTRVADEELLTMFTLRQTKVDIEFVRVSPSLYKDRITVSATDIDAFITDTAAQLEDAYNARFDQYHKPKMVQLAQIVFEKHPGYGEASIKEKKEQAELTLDDLKKGADFAKQAKQFSEDEATKDNGGELPPMTKDMLAARFGDGAAGTAIELTEGGMAIVESDKGFFVLRCLKVIPAEEHPLAEVKRDLAKQLLIDLAASEKARNEAERLLAGLKQGKNLTSLVPSPAIKPNVKQEATERALKVERTGMVSWDTGSLPKIGADDTIFRAAFELTKDKAIADHVFNIKSPTGADDFIVMTLADRADPDLTAFPEAKKGLEDEINNSRKQRQLETWIDRQRKQSKIEINQHLLAAGRKTRGGSQQGQPDDDW